MTGDVERYLVVGAVLFVLGALGFFTRRNLIVLMLSAEMMLHGVSLTLVTFSRLHHNLEGQAFTIFILTVAACEAGLALALILALYQKSNSLDIELWTELREPDLPPPMLVEDASQPAFTSPEPMYFPRLTSAGLVPEIRDVGDAERVDDAGSPTAESPLDEPKVDDVVKTARVD
jgi:NADH-quinone oxidoreductase subunit K